MSDLIIPRRSFLKVLTGVIAAPAVITADKLMQVKTIVQPVVFNYQTVGISYKITRHATIPPLVLDIYNKGLAESFTKTKEIYAANTLNSWVKS